MGILISVFYLININTGYDPKLTARLKVELQFPPQTSRSSFPNARIEFYDSGTSSSPMNSEYIKESEEGILQPEFLINREKERVLKIKFGHESSQPNQQFIFNLPYVPKLTEWSAWKPLQQSTESGEVLRGSNPDQLFKIRYRVDPYE